ncbi:MAG: hypothetical protein DWQ05_06500 [Calditrichaeota bacterium]|nr:MAG: hypothetical protein DWQ05_06500 [Calditrichota bacterium]
MKFFTFKRFVFLIIVILVIIQFVPVERSNPPESAPLVAQKEVAHILKTSCYDCHSNQTVWPWYSNVAPVSWILIDHVKEGRRHLNFSNWNEYQGKKKLKKLDELIEEVEEGNMPLEGYLKLHKDAILSTETKEKLLDWAHSEMDSVSLD